jgi:hypothetical protein
VSSDFQKRNWIFGARSCIGRGICGAPAAAFRLQIMNLNLDIKTLCRLACIYDQRHPCAGPVGVEIQWEE